MSQPESTIRAELAREIGRRRTFAIISHPDAGKTTLTEKLLLYSGMIRTAGMVGSRKSKKGATSDWMAMEQERGISITASAMQFTYKNTVINILDTPGHQDFSEDTYRTLTAADSVIMVIDAAKGVETQTLKLFEACRLRAIPVITFVNKCDLEGREPLDLMAEVEDTLGIAAAAKTWPIGMGRRFAGVVERDSGRARLYTKTSAGGATMPQIHELDASDKAALAAATDADCVAELSDALELLAAAGNPFRRDDFLAFRTTPVYFGSALTGFGIELVFDALIDLAPPPHARPIQYPDGREATLEPTDPMFSAYVFKLQANMNPKHRDVVAFMRINSGRYERDMQVLHHRTGAQVRLSRPHTLMAAERETLESAYPGDVIGVIANGQFAIGDTISTGKQRFTFAPLPQFTPELFAQVRLSDTAKRKALDKGLKQLAAEGAIQILYPWNDTGAYPTVGAVGRLQFEVMTYRLKNEYGVDVRLEPRNFTASAWLEGDPATFRVPLHAELVKDAQNRPMVLFVSPWQKETCAKDHPQHRLRDFSV